MSLILRYLAKKEFSCLTNALLNQREGHNKITKTLGEKCNETLFFSHRRWGGESAYDNFML